MNALSVTEQRHHHNVPADVFDEIPGEPKALPDCWFKRVPVPTADGADAAELLFYRTTQPMED